MKKYIFAAVAAIATVISAGAQTESSSGSVVRRNGLTERNTPGAEVGVTERMQSFYTTDEPSDADLQYMRVIYRQIDLDQPKNAALYYPEDLVDGQENLFRMIMRLLTDGKIKAYEYLDGREIFNDQYQLKVRDMLDRFYILYSEAKGSTEKNPKFVIEEADVPTNEVLSYYIIERWEFDSRTNKMKTRVEAICPVLHREGDFGGEAVKYPMFWVKLADLRPYMANQYIFIDDDNNLPRYTLDDFFAMNMYDGEIYKTRNLKNKSMAQLYPDPDDRKRAQDSIQNRLESFDKNLWVPSREEVIAAREAREAAAEGDSVTVPSRDEKKSVRSTRSSRGSDKDTKKTQSKQPKPAKTQSTATRSVRRTRK